MVKVQSRFPRALVGTLLGLIILSSPIFTETALAKNQENGTWNNSVNGSVVTVDGWRKNGGGLGNPVSWIIGDTTPPPPKTGLARCWEVANALGDPMVAECESYFWIEGPDGPQPLEHGSPGRPEPGVNIPVPSPRELIEYATAAVRAQGSGLTVQPKSDVLAAIPTIVYAQAASQVLETQIFGRPISVSLRATSFRYDFGDGSAPLITNDPGRPFPDHRLSHTYERPQDQVVITLTTTWSGTITSPFTGETATINGVVTTVESSDPFNVREASIALVDEDY